METTFVHYFPVIKQVIAAVSRRHQIPAADVPELSASIFLKIVENDYAVLRRLADAADPRAFLFTVVHNHMVDWRNTEWGRWRASARARQLGPAAVHLEEMIVRDRMHAQDAVALLAHHPRWGLSSDAARELHGRLNCRAPRRRPVGLAAVEATHMTPPAIDAIDLHELQVRTHVVRHALASAIRRLSIDERQLLKMRFQDGHSISDIAVLLNLDAKPLYRRFNRILRRLRSELERRRLTLSVVRELVGQNGAEFASDFPGESAA